MASGLIGGRYEIIREIAEGGMGAVYEARHHMTKKVVALKILFPHIGKNEASKARFLREVSAPAQIGHPGIVDVMDSGFDPNDGSLFVAMELLKGDTVREWLARGGHTRDDVLDLFDQVLEPLAAAHKCGIVHRDLKPENLFMANQRDGSVTLKVLDFGIARDLDTSDSNVTQTGMAMGTPHYMAPEQAMSARGVLATADVWALGVMLYEALCGSPPFDGETASAIVVYACTQPHTPMLQKVPDLSPALATLIDRCLSKTPTERPEDAAALQVALRAARGGRTGALAPIWKRDESATGPFATSQGVQRSLPTAPMSRMDATTAHTGAPQQHTPHSHRSQAGTAQQHGTPQPGAGPQAWHSTVNPATPAPAASPVNAPTASPVADFSNSTSSGGAGTSKVKYIAAAGLGVVVLAMLGGGIWVAVSGDDSAVAQEQPPGPTPPVPTPPAAQGSVTLSCNQTGGGELMIDNVSAGPVVCGQVVQMNPGAHRLVLRVAGSEVGHATVIVPAGGVATAQLSAQAAPLPGGPVQQQHGTLGPGDATLDSGEFSDNYTFQWNAGQVVRVEAISSAFDTYLIVKPPNGAAQLDNDDMAEGNRNAGLTVTCTVAGAYRVIVTSYQAGETGAYQLNIR